MKRTEKPSKGNAKVENSSLDRKVDKMLKVKEGSPLDKRLDAREAKILKKK